MHYASWGKNRITNIAIFIGALCLSLLVVEALLTLFRPMRYIVPANDWLPEYGVIAYPNAKIIDARPGYFKFIYTTNEQRYRGPLIEPSSPTNKILLLGDSNIFGNGVNDHETISHYMNQLLDDDTEVINLGNGGWSLPQEVRRYIELGQSFNPEVVILYVAPNDLRDYFLGINWVSYVDSNGIIRLRNVNVNPVGFFRTILPPDSLIYRCLFSSQVGALIKQIINRYAMAAWLNIHSKPDGDKELINLKKNNEITDIPSEQVIVMDFSENERRYAELLYAFSKMLKKQKVRFILLSNNKDFYNSKKIAELTQKLQNQNLLEYYEIDSWFKAGVDYPRAKEGHQWGHEATKVLADHLCNLIMKFE